MGRSVKEYKRGDLGYMVRFTQKRQGERDKLGVVLGRCEQPHLHDYGYYRVMWFHSEKETTAMWFMMEKVNEERN